jgi:Uma2 family endonuclease
MTVTPQDTAPAVSEQVIDTEPIHYGWRFVRRDLPDGNYTVEQIPLTLEDVLHPEEGDQVTHSDAHQRRWRYVCNVFNAQLSQDSTAVVLDDVRIKWDNPDIKPHGPDIMVIFSVRERKNWSTFDVATEGVRPTLIVEITSPETRTIDFVYKRDEYEFANVPLYIIVDSVTRRGKETLRLFGYTLTQNGYQVLAPDAQGRLWLEPVRLWIGIDEGEVYCYDENDRRIGDYADVVATLADTQATLADTQATLAAEQDARAAAEARVRELEAQLQQLKATGEQQ